MIFGPDGNVLIAVVQGPSHLDDARLIAAAPDLLAALQASVCAIMIRATGNNREHRSVSCVASDHESPRCHRQSRGESVMALSNILKEPRREITEQLVGTTL